MVAGHPRRSFTFTSSIGMESCRSVRMNIWSALKTRCKIGLFEDFVPVYVTEAMVRASLLGWESSRSRCLIRIHKTGPHAVDLKTQQILNFWHRQYLMCVSNSINICFKETVHQGII